MANTPAMRLRSLALLAIAAVLAGVLVAPVSAAESPAAAAPATWYRVDYATTIGSADRQALADLGITDVWAAPGNAYVVFAEAAQAVAIDALPAVSGTRPITAQEKIDPDLAGVDGTVAVQVIRAGASVPEEAEAVQASFRLTGQRTRARGSVFTADTDAIGAIAADPAVLHVGLTSTQAQPEDEGTAQILAGRDPVPGYADTLGELGVDGSGVTIAIVDTGVDEEHPDLDGQVASQVSYSRIPVTGEPVDGGGHGTHVAGIVAGTGAAALPGYGPLVDEDGLRYGQGVAPGADLVDANYLSTLGGLPAGGFPRMVSDMLAEGAIAWNASWTDGGGVGVGYNANASLLDALVRDGDFTAEGLQPFTLVFSAGNSGVGDGETSRITSPKEAKNMIAVAASNGQRAGNTELIASFSSRGPALDGRVVPTVTAPGASIASTRSWAGSSCSTPYALSVLHASCSGTSMAAPHVAGAVALLTEAWRRDHAGADPSPAMLKALLINTAVDLDVPDIPNRDEGWGRVDVGAALDPSAQRIVLDQDDLLTEVGQTTGLAFTAADPTQPVRVTLVWTDAPGLPEEELALVNDLDLLLTAPDGTPYAGNAFVDGLSVSGTDHDHVNNVENVYLPSGQAGVYQLSISAAALPGDGVPGNGHLTDQDFALVVDNGVLAEGSD
jgi:subtilisin family serine protease